MVFSQDGDDLAIVFFTTAAPALNYARVQTQFMSKPQTGGGGLVAYHDDDFCIWNSTFSDCIGERDHGRTTTGDENADPLDSSVVQIECHDEQRFLQRRKAAEKRRESSIPSPSNQVSQKFRA